MNGVKHMTSERYQVGKAPAVTISDCKGDLVIRPWLHLEVQAAGDFTTDETKDQLAFIAAGDLVLNVPEDANVHVEKAGGDVVIRSLNGDVSVSGVAGDVVLGNLNMAKVGQIKGDLVATDFSHSLSVQEIKGDVIVRNLDGDLALELVKGDAVVQNVSGALAISEIKGDISLQNINGDITIAKGHRDANFRNLGGRCQVAAVDGDIRLKGSLGPFEHTFASGGDMVIIWPTQAPLLLQAEAAEINNRLPLEDVVEAPGRLSGRLGDGKTRVNVQAGGRLVLKEAQIISEKWRVGGGQGFEFDFMSDLTDLGAKISSEVGEQVARVTAELESNFGPDFMQRMAEQFSRKAGAAAERARQAAERQGEQAKTRAQRRQPNEASKSGASGAATQEARLKILKMVEKGVISPDEADMLLKALDGD
jgi:SHOCT-like domain/Toastrack DUF4097